MPVITKNQRGILAPESIRAKIPEWLHSIGDLVSVNPITTTIPAGQTVYHGTVGKLFDFFKPSPKGTPGLAPQLTHFSEDSNWANKFAKGFAKDTNARVIPAELPAGEYLDLQSLTDLEKIKPYIRPQYRTGQFGKLLDSGDKWAVEEALRDIVTADPQILDRAGFKGIKYLDANNPAYALNPLTNDIKTPWKTPLTSIGGLK